MYKILITIVTIFYFVSCSSAPRYASNSGIVSSKSKTKKYSKSSSKSDKKKKIKHKKKIIGISSFYAEDFHGKLTANGEVYDMYGLTAAHKTLPLNTIIRVTNLSNNKSLILRVNDRGPYIKGRILDCSYGAAKKLDFLKEGTTKVQIDVIEWGDGEYMHHRKLKK